MGDRLTSRIMKRRGREGEGALLSVCEGGGGWGALRGVLDELEVRWGAGLECVARVTRWAVLRVCWGKIMVECVASEKF